MGDITKHYRDVVRVLKIDRFPDPYFLSRYRFSPYMACQNACKYCDGRAEKYHVAGDYEKDIIIRQNTAAMLQLELGRLREKGIISIGSGISDPYQPVEESEKIMAECLQILLQYDHAVSVHTKSALILRDIELCSKINLKNGFILYVSLTTLDDRIRKIFEPGASTTAERITMIETFKKNGIPVAVLAMPFLPFITDSRQNIGDLFQTLKQIDIDFVLPWNLTLRPGKQKDFFLDLLDIHYPEMRAAYDLLYANDLPSGMPHYQYRQALNRLTTELREISGLKFLPPHSLFKPMLALYDVLYILLCHMKIIYAGKGQDIQRLNRAVENYINWLSERKKYYNRRTKMSFCMLEEEIKETAAQNRLAVIFNNSRLSLFLRKIILDNRILDYSDLQLK
ncbi:MAG: radical SAM protein [Candidatus Cloacimonetes bacterium]|nr:radical SAM protein [Candidatus Cloacimonadota bacterium]